MSFRSICHWSRQESPTLCFSRIFRNSIHSKILIDWIDSPKLFNPSPKKIQKNISETFTAIRSMCLIFFWFPLILYKNVLVFFGQKKTVKKKLENCWNHFWGVHMKWRFANNAILRISPPSPWSGLMME